MTRQLDRRFGPHNGAFRLVFQIKARQRRVYLKDLFHLVRAARVLLIKQGAAQGVRSSGRGSQAPPHGGRCRTSSIDRESPIDRSVRMLSLDKLSPLKGAPREVSA
ncbi:MAG: hypothetical protein ICV60_06450 [Pyrinomonadaceae bacterium]|nr:hypothetical protein [Pyrinomonadaceae bacterium]